MDNILLFTNSVEVSERKDGENLHMKICLCDFHPNKNGTKLNRATISNWIDSLINAPIVGKVSKDLATGLTDFTSHNMKYIIGENGKREVVLDTEAYGTITGYEIYGSEEPSEDDKIYITAEIFARFERVINLVESRALNGGLSTSWEISILDSHYEGETKVIDYGRFIGHTLLGKNVVPAYDCSKLMECAEADGELALAISNDLESLTKDGEQMEDFEVVISADEVENIEEQIDESECAKKPDEEEKSECGKKPEDEEESKCGDKEEEESECGKKPEDEEEPEQSSLEDKLIAMSEALMAANEKISALEAEISELLPYKEQAELAKAEEERLEHERKISEISSLLTKGGYISESELTDNAEIAEIINTLNFNAAKILIADRVLASIDSEKPFEVSSKRTSVVSASIVETDSRKKSDDVRAFLNIK